MQHEATNGAYEMKPTPDEIEAVIAGMVGVGPLGCGDPDEPYVPLWWVHAYDPEGTQRGIGTDVTLAGALAAAWVLSHDQIADRFGLVPLDMQDFLYVPRHVPDGWTFEIDNMPTQGRA
jgi:hypothetical protein